MVVGGVDAEETPDCPIRCRGDFRVGVGGQGFQTTSNQSSPRRTATGQVSHWLAGMSVVGEQVRSAGEFLDHPGADPGKIGYRRLQYLGVRGTETAE